MTQFSRSFAALGVALVLACSPALAAPADDVVRLQQSWAHIKYQSPPASQEAQFAQLRSEAEQVAARNPSNADVLIWYAIIESTYAGAKGGLGALKYAKSARATLERAVATDPEALGGSAYTSLGSLYYQVPGWPIGFGDDARAQDNLKKGLAINPDGIDANFFYGDYLLRKGDAANAERYLRHALQAAPRPGRKLADDGRRGEIAQLLEKISAGKK